jgi:hypothetical protein
VVPLGEVHDNVSLKAERSHLLKDLIGSTKLNFYHLAGTAQTYNYLQIYKKLLIQGNDKVEYGCMIDFLTEDERYGPESSLPDLRQGFLHG